MTRTQAREIAYKMIFGDQFVDKGFDKEDFANLMEGEKFDASDMEFVQNLVVGVRTNLDALKDIIGRNLSAYKYDRLFSADKAALLLCTYELKYNNEETPAKVAINEALNLVKKYSTEKSSAFVNSVINKIYKEIFGSNE